MRFCSSDALANAEKFMFWASCSAADAMKSPKASNGRRVRYGTRRQVVNLLGCLGGFRAGHSDLAARFLNRFDRALGSARHGDV